MKSNTKDTLQAKTESKKKTLSRYYVHKTMKQCLLELKIYGFKNKRHGWELNSL
jgi:hypothetical protein